MTTYAGRGAPSSGLGTTGDFYIDGTGLGFYGPKSGSGWGTPTLFQGAPGSPGAPGTGSVGAAGATLQNGTGTPTTLVGNIGDFYIQTGTWPWRIYGPKTVYGWGSGTGLASVVNNITGGSGSVSITSPDSSVSIGGTGSSPTLSVPGVAINATAIATTNTALAALSAGATVTRVLAKTANYTAVAGDIVLATATSAPFTVTLPAPTTNLSVWVKKVDSSANAVTVASSSLIDGATTYPLPTQYDAVQLIANGTTWSVF